MGWDACTRATQVLGETTKVVKIGPLYCGLRPVHGQMAHGQMAHGQMVHGQMAHGQMAHGQLPVGLLCEDWLCCCAEPPSKRAQAT